MVGVDGLPPTHVSEELIHLGYEALGEAGVPGRFYFRRREAVSFNVHVVEREGTHWKSNLALRDYLRRYPEEVSRYEDAKVAAVLSGASSLLKYSEAKAVIITELFCHEQKAGERPLNIGLPPEIEIDFTAFGFANRPCSAHSIDVRNKSKVMFMPGKR